MRALRRRAQALVLTMVVTLWLTAGSPIFAGSAEFIRSDVNGDGTTTLVDAVQLLQYMFPPAGGNNPLSCLDAADFNDDDSLNLPDAVGILSYLFASGAAPASPFPTCGTDPTPGALGCEANASCFAANPALTGQLLRRMAYGPTPADVAHVNDIGAFGYIAEQLSPELIDESGNTLLNQLLQNLEPESDLNDLYRYQFARGIYSQRQLQETLTNFWDNHFNTNVFTVRSYFRNSPIYDSSQSLAVATSLEYGENELFRENVLSPFETLVQINATSVTMLIYLDNISNIAGDPNENYARELLELHTMGVDNGYIQSDIEEVARCFTGWNICFLDPLDVGDPHADCQPVVTGTSNVWGFHFDPDLHDYTEKVIFEGTAYELVIPARPVGSTDGIQDGFEVISHLVGLPQTAEFVSTKLIQKLVADQAPPALVAACIGEWLSSDGDIRDVVEVILQSDEFLGTDYRWNKVRTPMESVLATVRAFDGVLPNVNVVRNSIASMGHLPFTFGTPDGYPEFGADQLGTAKLLSRILFNQNTSGTNPNYDFPALLAAASVPPEDVDAIVDHFLEYLYPSNWTPIDRQLAIDFLGTDENGVQEPLDTTASDYESRLAQFATFVISFPQGMKQ